MPGKRLAIDIGGTFVDFVLLDEGTGRIRIEKEPSPETELTNNIFQGIGRLQVEPAELGMIVYGSTVVINTILQERGGNKSLAATSCGQRTTRNDPGTEPISHISSKSSERRIPSTRARPIFPVAPATQTLISSPCLFLIFSAMKFLPPC